MLEDFAAEYVYRSQLQLQVIGALVIMAAFVCAVFVPRGPQRLGRAPFFALSAVLFLIGVMLHLTWGAAINGVASPLFWVILVVEIVATLGLGTVCGVAATARSRDAFGHGLAGLLAVIPVANLILFLAPTRTVGGETLVGSRQDGLILAGVALMVVAGGLLVASDNQIADPGQGRRSPSSAEMAGVEALIGAHGLEVALKRVAEAEARAVGDGHLIVLHSVEAEGAILRYRHVISANAWFFDNDFRLGIVEFVCSSAGPAAILNAGGRIVRAFQSRDGEVLGSIVITRLEC